MKLNSSKNGHVPGNSDQWIQQQQHQGPGHVVGTTWKNANNITMHMGEGAPTGRGIPPVPGTQDNRVGYENDQNQQLGYEDLARILGLRRIGSECASDLSDFASAKGSLKEAENGEIVDKLCRNNTEDGDTVEGSRKAFGELNCHRGADFSPTVLPEYAFESPHSGNFNTPRGFDRSHSGKKKLLCSFGGKILPRPSDGKLRYVGGDTRIISISDDITWEGLMKKTSDVCNQPHCIKYQLPGEDLDALISVSSDEDLQNMMEEYHDHEKLEGSQRLRIFLIPLSESENSSSLEGTTIPENSPDYSYVVAVNGIFDPNTRRSSDQEGLASEASLPKIVIDHSLSSHKRSSSFLRPLEVKAGNNAFHPTRFSNESQNRSPYQSPPISPIPLQRGDGKSSSIQSHGDSFGMESSSSFVSAQLSPENCRSDAAVYKLPSQGVMTLMDYHHPSNQVDHGLSDLQYGVKFHNPNLSNEQLTSSVFYQNGDFDGFIHERSIYKDRAFLSEKPVFGREDSALFSESIESIDSHHGMTHAFSDSKLQEHGAMSAYCSQEGMSPSSPLNFSKTRLSAMLIPSASQEKPNQLFENTSFVNPLAQTKLLDSESTVSQSRVDLLSLSSHLESRGNGRPIIKVSSNMYDLCTTQNHHQENLLSLETEKRIEPHNQLLLQVVKPYEEKAPAASIECEEKPHDLNHNPPSSGVNVLAQGVRVATDKIPAPSAVGFRHHANNVMDSLQNYHQERGPSNFLVIDQGTANTGCSTLSGVDGENCSNNQWIRNPEGKDLFHNASQQPCDNSLVDMLSGLSTNPLVAERTRFQCLESQDEIFNKQALPTCSTECSSCKVCEDDCANAELKMNSLHTAPYKTAASYVRQTSGLDDIQAHSNQKVGMGDFEGSSYDMLNFEDTKLAQTKTPTEDKVSTQLEAVTCNVPSGARKLIPPTAMEADRNLADIVDPTSRNFVSSTVSGSVSVTALVADSMSSDFVDLESMVPDYEFEDMQADNDEHESISESMIAEIEASIYGLQIIRNADLEEMRELGSGTFGTVFHGKWRGTDVAIKRIKKSCFSGRSSEQERLTKDFWREAQILSNLHHPNVVAFYGVVPDGTGGTLATVTEYMVNGSLRHVLLKKDRSLDRRKKLIIAMDAAFGMEYLHSKNIVHFDLKCDNLLVNLRDPQRPICKVGDFGLSRIKRNTLVSGGVRGTLPWMAPELLNGSSSRVSEKVDVFSFGISLWEILTGEEPYADMHCGAIIGGIVKNTLRPTIPERCDSQWRTLMEQCWSADPDARPSFTEITNRLRAMSMALQAKGHNGQGKEAKANPTS
ncbi:hypothetical protein Tsubulata_050141 [Turnera subulata]|uniref:Protein kinase domain-containing protein n=1 Tax=Turnera subulata TaxID=218843 RepID=A0A9Q0F4D2_9ROSI|nr:hypothetical protein Tsubulata_050141 [Turnera subulata]